MVESQTNLSLADIALTSSSIPITAPFKPWRNGGLINRHELHKTLQACGDFRGVQPDVSYGINVFLHKNFPEESFRLAPIATFMIRLAELTGGINFYKSRSLNYLSSSNDVNSVLDQILQNAKFMIDTFGIDFFSRSNRFPERRKAFFRALVPDSNFYLTVKGGSGASTFSVDFALEIDKGQDYTRNTGEIWRTGFDTEISPDGELGVRIIRTGSGVKHDPIKTEQFEGFKRSFKTSPARALTFLLLACAQKLHPDYLIALSTIGAQRISSLKRNRHEYHYAQLFHGMNFVGQEEDEWLQLTDFPHPRKREKAGMERLTEAFRNLRDADGKTFL